MSQLMILRNGPITCCHLDSLGMCLYILKFIVLYFIEKFMVLQWIVLYFHGVIVIYKYFRYVVLTTSGGIMDHEEARRKHLGGKILGFFF